MANLTAARRKGMSKKSFAGPGKSFPINDAEHERLAIGGATRSERAGNISAGEAATIKAKARAKLGDGDSDSPSPKRAGARDGMGRGKGGMAIHDSAKGLNLDNDKPMRHERY